jgi:hypothetical protein
LPKLAPVLEYAALQGEDVDVVEALASCNWKIERCGLLGCPSCYRQIKRRAIKDTHRLIGAASRDKLPDSDHISCVSINWPVEGLVPVTIRRAERRFRSRLTRTQRTTASSTSISSILHPNRSKADLEVALKRRFPIRAAWTRQNDSVLPFAVSVPFIAIWLDALGSR